MEKQTYAIGFTHAELHAVEFAFELALYLIKGDVGNSKESLDRVRLSLSAVNLDNLEAKVKSAHDTAVTIDGDSTSRIVDEGSVLWEKGERGEINGWVKGRGFSDDDDNDNEPNEVLKVKEFKRG